MGVSKRSNKTEIWEAYQEALEKVDSQTDKKTEVTKERNLQLVEEVSQKSPEDVVRNLADLRLSANSVISEIEEKILSGKTELDNLTAALIHRKGEMQEMHEIEVHADTLAALILAFHQAKTAFDEEKRIGREAWAKEKAETELSRQENELHWRKKQDRQTEEFDYLTKINTERQQDNFRERENEVERRLKSREEDLVSKEEGIEILRTKVSEIPELLEKAKIVAAEDAKASAGKSHGFALRAVESKLQNADEISNHQIGMLRERVDTLTDENKFLSVKLDEANTKITEVAREAIKGAQTKIIQAPAPIK